MLLGFHTEGGHWDPPPLPSPPPQICDVIITSTATIGSILNVLQLNPTLNMSLKSAKPRCIDTCIHPLHTSTFPPPGKNPVRNRGFFFTLSTSSLHVYMYQLYHHHSTHLPFISPHPPFLSFSLTHTHTHTYTYLRVLTRHPAHVLWVQLDRVISQLGLCGSLEVLTANWEVTVSLHPPAKCASHECHNLVWSQDIT